MEELFVVLLADEVHASHTGVIGESVVYTQADRRQYSEEKQ